MNDHVGLEGLLLDEALEADVTLEGSDAVVNQHVPLQIGRQREFSRTHVTLVAFHPLRQVNTRKSSQMTAVEDVSYRKSKNHL